MGYIYAFSNESMPGFIKNLKRFMMDIKMVNFISKK